MKGDVLVRYAMDMSDERFIYCFTVLELMKRGFRYRDAKSMVLGSPLLEEKSRHWAWLLSYDQHEFADWVVSWHLRKGKLKYIA